MFAGEGDLEMPHLGVTAILRIHHAPLAPAAPPQGLHPQVGRVEADPRQADAIPSTRGTLKG